MAPRWTRGKDPSIPRAAVCWEDRSRSQADPHRGRPGWSSSPVTSTVGVRAGSAPPQIAGQPEMTRAGQECILAIGPPPPRGHLLTDLSVTPHFLIT